MNTNESTPAKESVTDRPSERGDEESEDLSSSNPRHMLMVQLGHVSDPGHLIDTFLKAQQAFEMGNNRRAWSLLNSLDGSSVSAELQEQIRLLQERIRPDKAALLVFFAGLIILVVIWILAV